jgi:hypothetical protein
MFAYLGFGRQKSKQFLNFISKQIPQMRRRHETAGEPLPDLSKMPQIMCFLFYFVENSHHISF